MKKRDFLTLVVTLMIGVIAHGQCTIDFSITSPGIFPDTSYDFVMNGDTLIALKNVDPAVAYESEIQFMVPADTQYAMQPGLPPMTIPINNMVLDGIDGLPNGITYACNPGTCTFNGNSNGCIKLSGSVAAADTGIYRLTLNITANVTFSGSSLPMPIEDSSFVMIVGNVSVSPSGIRTAPMVVKHLEVFPNPLAEEGTISFYVSESADVNVSVVDMIGNVVYSNALSNVSGIQNLGVNTAELGSGVYFITVTNGLSTMTKKVLIN